MGVVEVKSQAKRRRTRVLLVLLLSKLRRPGEHNAAPKTGK